MSDHPNLGGEFLEGGKKPLADDHVTKQITLRQSMWEQLQVLFELIRANVGVGQRMTNEDCFMMLLDAAVPYLSKQLRAQAAAMADRAAPGVESAMISELSFVGSDDLINELAKRYSQLLIVGEARSHDKINHTRLQHFGSKIMAIGLAEFARASIIDAINKGDSGH